MDLRTPLRPRRGIKKVLPPFDPKSQEDQPLDLVAWINIRDRKMLMGLTAGEHKFVTIGGRRKYLPGGLEDEATALARTVREQVGVEIDAQSAYNIHVFRQTTKKGRHIRLSCYSADGLGLPIKNPAVLDDMRYLGSKDKHLLTQVCKDVFDWLEAAKIIA